MRTLQVVRSLSLLLLSVGLTACGMKAGPAPVIPVTPAPAQTPPTTLDGNWFLTGSRVPQILPTLSTSLVVQGSVVSGQVTFAAQCTSGGTPTGVSGTLSVSGTIANDGSFHVSPTIVTTGGPGTLTLSLSGNSPLPAAPTTWTGSYSLTFTPAASQSSCSIAQTGTFAATPIASLTGTYIGVPTYPTLPGPFGAGAAVSLQMTQGAPVAVTSGAVSSYLIPLTATLNIANSPCSFNGSTAGVAEPSSISGDSFTLVVTPASPTALWAAS